MEVKVRHFFAVICWLLQLANSSPQQQLLQLANSSPQQQLLQLANSSPQQQLLQACCGVILLGSGGPAAVSQQADRLGVYRISGLLNGRPVYKHERNRGDATLQRQNTEISKQIFPEKEWVSVPISTFMRLWAIYIFPRSVSLFCCRKYVDRSWDYINRSQAHEC